MKKATEIISILFAAAVVTHASEGLAQHQQGDWTRDGSHAEISREQTGGAYSVMDMEHVGSLGMMQRAWNDPMRNLGEGQSRPGYSRYWWRPDTVLPIRLREGMMTLINFPAWELIENVWIGAQDAFYGEVPTANSLLLYPAAGVVGVDSNMVVFGRSGNRYAFYLRSETYNTERITNTVVDVMASAPAGSGGGGRGGSGVLGNFMGGGNSGRNSGGPHLNRDKGPDWMETVPVNPEAFRFDLDILIPNPEDVDIAPERVWRDEIFTYIDFGERALSMNNRPVVSLLQQESETPVGFRTRGKHGRMMIVEAVGDLVLRNGRKVVCIKLRRDPAFGTRPEFNNRGIVDMASGPGSSMAMGMGMSPIPQGAYGGMGMMDVYSGMHAYGRRQSSRTAMRGDVSSGIAIELGSDHDIARLERVWDTVQAQNRDVLGAMQPYFSVDAKAEDGGRDSFHLRVGPVENVNAGEEICAALGRRGARCSVIRTE
ncbi:MAG: TrbG/VirB9 family P-type conjugative transfer protein [Alphaproteobacteria bacterium]|nr:TrbG/VirB9 family P-type conjugative transfer protein [Alphaproteobacteria bacterium]